MEDVHADEKDGEILFVLCKNLVSSFSFSHSLVEGLIGPNSCP